MKVSLEALRFLLRIGGGTLLYDCYDRKVYIAVHVVVVGEVVLIGFSLCGGLCVI